MAIKLRSSGFVTLTCSSTISSITYSVTVPVTIGFLDIKLPGLDGLEICKKVRRRFSGPILMLTGLRSENDQLAGFNSGADAYISKPVHPRLIMARAEALLSLGLRRELRKNGPQSPGNAPDDESRRIDLKNLRLDAEDRSVTIGDDPVELTNSEFNLLWFLACRADETVSRRELFKCLRDHDWNGFDRSVDIAIMKLRKKLGDHGKRPRYIESVRGIGYKVNKN